MIFYAIKRCFPVFLTAIFLVGCGTTYNMQGANEIEKSQLATLDTKFPFFTQWIYVLFVDGKSRGFGDFDTYKLVPGERVITISGNPQLGLYRNYTDVAFNAEAGKFYKLIYEDLGGGVWATKIVDKATNERVDFEQTYPDCRHSLLGSVKCTHAMVHLNEKRK